MVKDDGMEWAIHSLGFLYKEQCKLGEAEQMFERALRGYEEALGPKHTSTLQTVNNLGNLYADQGKLDKAEQMYERALRGYKEVLGSEDVERYRPALNTMINMGNLYKKREEFTKARQMFARALPGLQTILGPSSNECQYIRGEIEALDLPRGKIQGIVTPT